MTELTNQTKICTSCKKHKPIACFGQHKITNDGLSYVCNECRSIESAEYRRLNPEKVKVRNATNRKKYNRDQTGDILKHRYGITIEDYDGMYIEQGGRCAICGNHQSKMNRRLSVDHCHETGKVRGLLCINCNAGLGNYRDNLALLENAVKYLKTNK